MNLETRLPNCNFLLRLVIREKNNFSKLTVVGYFLELVYYIQKYFASQKR